jgi:apolipoprotein N-acyltransferase
VGLEAAGILARRPAPGTVLIVGATRYVDSARAEASGARFENVALALEPGEGGRPGVVDAVYKRQLVPFAESLYWRDPGPYHGLATSRGRLGVLICYESIYPGVTEALVDDGVGPLLVVTNDAGLRRSYVAEIHARLGIVRAIESGRGLVHAGQAGLTFFADAGGRRTPGLGLFERGVLYGAVTEEVVWTPYAWSGRAGWLGGALVGWAVLVMKVRWRMKAKRVA